MLSCEAANCGCSFLIAETCTNDNADVERLQRHHEDQGPAEIDHQLQDTDESEPGTELEDDELTDTDQESNGSDARLSLSALDNLAEIRCDPGCLSHEEESNDNDTTLSLSALDNLAEFPCTPGGLANEEGLTEIDHQLQDTDESEPGTELEDDELTDTDQESNGSDARLSLSALDNLAETLCAPGSLSHEEESNDNDTTLSLSALDNLAEFPCTPRGLPNEEGPTEMDYQLQDTGESEPEPESDPVDEPSTDTESIGGNLVVPFTGLSALGHLATNNLTKIAT
ncbi:hypothetical protein ONE63_011209 [Megalurothrips usitatus]|uniref:Uncharacterized protein n=1 Tax=Megalurothrips usitatus TaxID=439358 RepID=A0AAV7X2G3_9NEOP|nr:hypothetical protein ONE63_011209 [Megalurothrips usitatus]